MHPNVGIPATTVVPVMEVCKIDSKVSKVVTTWNNRRQQAADIKTLAASTLADGSESNDEEENEQRTGK
jgi:hypothetical protein